MLSFTKNRSRPRSRQVGLTEPLEQTASAEFALKASGRDSAVFSRNFMVSSFGS